MFVESWLMPGAGIVKLFIGYYYKWNYLKIMLTKAYCQVYQTLDAKQYLSKKIGGILLDANLWVCFS